MTHIPLPDLDQMTGVVDAKVSVANETIDVSSHALAAAAADVWEMTPLQTKDGFGRAQGDIWLAADWSFKEFELSPVLFKMDERHSRDHGSQVAIERWMYGEERGVCSNGETYTTGPGELNFLDQHQQYQSFASQRRMQSISLPRALLELPDDQPVDLPCIEQSSAIGQLVFAEWDDLYADLQRGNGGLSRAKMERNGRLLENRIGR